MTLSPTHVVGYSNHGCGYGAEARIWTARRQADDTLTDFRLGPIVLDEPVVAVRPKTWGDYVSMGYGPRHYSSLNERGRLLLLRTTDWAMREFRGPEGHELGISTLTDRYLYATPQGLGTKFSEIYRYDLEHFDQIGNPVRPADETPGP